MRAGGLKGVHCMSKQHGLVVRVSAEPVSVLWGGVITRTQGIVYPICFLRDCLFLLPRRAAKQDHTKPPDQAIHGNKRADTRGAVKAAGPVHMCGWVGARVRELDSYRRCALPIRDDALLQAGRNPATTIVCKRMHPNTHKQTQGHGFSRFGHY